MLLVLLVVLIVVVAVLVVMMMMVVVVVVVMPLMIGEDVIDIEGPIYISDIGVIMVVEAPLAGARASVRQCA